MGEGSEEDELQEEEEKLAEETEEDALQEEDRGRAELAQP